jgi:pimeloyl-ACP methyl ester carboxylesterase
MRSEFSEMPSQSVNVGIKLNFHEWEGFGPEVILLHSLGEAASEWSEVGEAFAPELHTFALDQRGHGRSEKPKGPYTLEAYVGDFLNFMDAMGIDQVHLIGHGMGARIAWYFAVMHPSRVARLVVEDEHPFPQPNEAAKWRKLQKLRLPFEEKEEALKKIEKIDTGSWAEWLRRNLVEVEGGWGFQFSAEAVVETARELYKEDHWQLLSRIACPSLLLCGERSPVLSQDVAERMQQGMRGCRLIVFPETGHWIHRERRDAFVKIATEFLKG